MGLDVLLAADQRSQALVSLKGAARNKKKGGGRAMRFKRILAMVALVPVLALGSVTMATAAPDIEPPTVSSLEFDKSVVDTGSSSRSVRLTMELSDPSGVNGIRLMCMQRSTNSSLVDLYVTVNQGSLRVRFGGVFEDATIVQHSSTETSASWVIDINFPFNRPSGECEWGWATSDLAGNSVSGLIDTPLRLQILQSADSEPAKVDATSVVVSNGSPSLGDTVNIRFRVTDDTAIGNVSVFVKTPEPNQTSIQGLLARKVSGSSTDAIYSIDVTFPASPFPPGTWKIELAPQDIYNKGGPRWPVYMNVEGQATPVDTEPATVDISSVVLSNQAPSLGETINIRFRVTDDTAIGNVSVFVLTPEPNQTSISGLFATKVAGSSTDAVYSVDVAFPASPYPAGTWKIDLAPQDIYNKGGPRWPVYVNVARSDLDGQTESIGASGEQDQLQVQRAGSQLVIYSENDTSGTFEVFEDAELIDTFTLGDAKTAHVIEQRVTGDIRIERADSNGSTAVKVTPTRSLLWYQNYNLGLVNPSFLNATQRAAVDGLARSYKSANGTWTPRGQSTSKFICTGIYGPGASFADKVDARKRAKVACETAQSMNPTSQVSFWFQTKETKALSYANKVLVTVKGLETFVAESLG